MNKHSARNVPYQQKKRNMIVAAKLGPCVDCGKDFGDWRVMDLDHVPERGPKLFSPSNRYSEGRLRATGG